jgi:putrescine:ornithine antiporter
VLDRQFTYAPFAMAMKRGSEDLRLLVDRSLSRLYRSGEITQVYSRFFGAPGKGTQQFFEHTALPE